MKTDALPYAGFRRRLGAQIFDVLIFAPVIFVLGFIANSSGAAGESGAAGHGVTDFLIEDLLPFAVVVLLWWRYAATPGKCLLECRIVDARTGERPRLGQAVLRYLGYFASFLPLGLGFLWILWDPRKQGFHDKISGTVVLYAPEDEATKSLAQLARESR